MKMLSQDSFDWQLLGSLTSSLNSFWTARNYMPEVTFFKHASLCKFDCIFPFPIEKVICACVPAYEALIFDDNVTSFQDLGSFSTEDLKKKGYKMNSERTCSVLNFDIKLPFPLYTSRKYPVCSSVDYDPEKGIFHMIHKPCQHINFNTDKFEWKVKRKGSVVIEKKKGGEKNRKEDKRRKNNLYG